MTFLKRTIYLTFLQLVKDVEMKENENLTYPLPELNHRQLLDLQSFFNELRQDEHVYEPPRNETKVDHNFTIFTPPSVESPVSSIGTGKPI